MRQAGVEGGDTAAAPTVAKMPGQDGDDSMMKGCRKTPTHRRLEKSHAAAGMICIAARTSLCVYC